MRRSERLTWVIGGLLLLACSCSAVTLMDEKTEEDKKSKHQLHWWESKKTDQPTPADQLAEGDRLLAAGNVRAATRRYRALVYAWPQAPEAPVAQLNYARILEQRGKNSQAFEEYQYLIETYSGFIAYDDVLERQYRIADALAMRGHFFLFFKYQRPEDAIPLFEQIIQNAPHWDKAIDLQFRIARIYEKTEQQEMAIETYALFRQRYPLHPLAEQACFGQAKCAYLYAEANPNSTDLRENAAATLQIFLVSYPQSPLFAQVQSYLKNLQMEQASFLYQQAGAYDQIAGRTRDRKEMQTLTTAAKVSYQRVVDEYPFSRWAEMARLRIGQLEALEEKNHAD